MRIAVTGGMGFIGTDVVSRLIIEGHDVVIVDFWDDLIKKYEAARYPILEVTYANLMTAADVVRPYDFLADPNGVDAIIHLGAVVDTMNLADSTLVDLNVEYTRHLVEGLKHRVPIVFASSAATYGSKGYPNNPYGLSKVMGERFVREHEAYAILRFFNVFGKFEHHKGNMASVPFKLAQAYVDNCKFEMHSLDASRDFVPVSVVADCVIDCTVKLHAERYSKTFDVGSGKATSFADLDNFIMQARGLTVSAVKQVAIPTALVGRYQAWTQAGQYSKNAASCDTREWLEKYYGNR